LIDRAGKDNAGARLFTGPRGGRITTSVPQDATHWDDVVNKLGCEHLRRHDVRHAGPSIAAVAAIEFRLSFAMVGTRTILRATMMPTSMAAARPTRRRVSLSFCRCSGYALQQPEIAGYGHPIENSDTAVIPRSLRIETGPRGRL
jgi:hypothetical protein